MMEMLIIWHWHREAFGVGAAQVCLLLDLKSVGVSQDGTAIVLTLHAAFARQFNQIKISQLVSYNQIFSNQTEERIEDSDRQGYSQNNKDFKFIFSCIFSHFQEETQQLYCLMEQSKKCSSDFKLMTQGLKKDRYSNASAQIENKPTHRKHITYTNPSTPRDKSHLFLTNRKLVTKQSNFITLSSQYSTKHISRCQDNKENQQILYNSLYNYKSGKLNTVNTSKQKERYMRKLALIVEGDTFKAANYQFDSDYMAVINNLFIYSKITKIILDNNPLGDEGVIKLTNIFPQIRLAQLSLVSVNLNNRGAAALFQSLKGISTIKKLNISTVECTTKNRVTYEGVEGLNQLLNDPKCTLVTLLMNNINLGNEGVRRGFDKVKCQSLQQLSLSKNDLGIKHFQFFTTSLSNIPLMILNLSKNKLTNSGMKCLTDILGMSYGKNVISMNLVHLNLRRNMINSHGFQFFCREMGVNQTLQTLFIDDNPLGQGDRLFNIKYYLTKNWGLKKISLSNISPNQKDIRFICQGLEMNRSLQELILSKNEIDGEIFCFILIMLSKNKSLRRMGLNNCKISDHFIVKNEYLIQNSHLSHIEEIELENNYINNKGAQVLKNIITKNQNILKLSLAKNCISEAIIEEIAIILKQNQQKRPFEHELNYFKSVSDLFEQKKRALNEQVKKIKRHQQCLQVHLLAETIQRVRTIEEKLKEQINSEQDKIKMLQKSSSNGKMDV